MNMRKSVVVLVAVCISSLASAALYIWDDGGADSDYGTSGNWSPDGNPGDGDLAVHNSGASTIQVTENASADSLRLSDGGTVNQTGGTLTIATGVGGDNGLWVGEFGPAGTSYTLNNGTVQINDSADGFMVGKGGGSTGTFALNSGTVNNTVGDTHIGLDGTAIWNQSAGTFNGAGVHIGRFQSPTATVNLSGTAVWNVGLLLMSDGYLGSAVQSDLNLIGGGLTLDTTGLVMKDIANLTFDGTGGGLSTLDLNGGQLLLNNGELFLNNLPSASFIGETIVLVDNIGSFTGEDTQFDNALDGTVYGDWEIDYTGSQVQLVSVVPEPATIAMVGLGSGIALFIRRRFV